MTMHDPHSSDVRHIQKMMSALPVASIRPSKLWIPFLNHLLDEDLCKNSFDFHIFSFFLALKYDFIIYIDFTYISASNTAIDDVTN